MNVQDYLQRDAVALAEAVRSGETTASELLQLALKQHARAQPRTNAICTLMEREAQAQLARPATGPLTGVPFLIKDCAQDYAGLPTAYGSKALAGVAAGQHAHVVRRYLDAGLIIFGKTNLPELALKGVSDSRAFGRVDNPWNAAHTPGGSSGGAAAAVASGVVPMAAGNDGGGSIRIPAACCGLFGLKPSRGLVSSGPGFGEYWFGASCEGVISRSVRDTALALDVIAGAEPGDPFLVAEPGVVFANAVTRDPTRLRIGFTAASPIGTEVHAEAKLAVENAVKLLQGLGHEVEEATPDIDGAALATSFLHIYFGQVAALVADAGAKGAKREEFELLTRVLATLGGAISAGALTAQLLKWNGFARALARFHARYDLLLTPTLAHPPIRHGQGDPTTAEQTLLDMLDRIGLLGVLTRWGLLDGLIDKIARDSLQYVPFTQAANLTGTPAMSVPLHWTADGLPLGVQFTGRLGDELRLLQLARQLEQAQPWFERLPEWVRAG
ncbi:amidase [Bradyrhizobium sp. SSBR45G]|uniref:amidase n=1 Tax=unclassified Bradyrhizobium TaxID=2631580 RepID=UPI002342A8D6|nr:MULTISPECIES: amidase [unclassified Bradyrhizobium]GLH79489.1 amidase [Bradyrhizobium sp. SSBR45G]GLH86866.1 amidase [Bradyrhizobium sp. SSBR45R]